MKPPMKQENKHPTPFGLLFYVSKQLLRDCSGGQASRSRQNRTLLELRLINIDTDAIYKVSGYDQEIPRSQTADQPTAQITSIIGSF